MLDCGNSYIDSSRLEADGILVVCLTNTNGTKYFDNFDIGGNPATNASQAVTGFVGGSSDLIQDYDVDAADEPVTHQCFYINYTPAAGATSDRLILQPTDESFVPVGDACELLFDIDQGTGGGDNNLNCAASFIDTKLLSSQGVLIVCLQHNNGTPFFEQFDIGGLAATNASVAQTGFITGTSDLIQDYDVATADDSPNHQCFYIQYTPAAGATSDTLVLQPVTDPPDRLPIGDACELMFNIPQTSNGLDCTQSDWL